MSDDMGTDKHGRKRRAIRRLTQRTIPLPTSASLPPSAASPPSAGDAQPAAGTSAVDDSPLGASVASTLSELRLPSEPTEPGAATLEAGASASLETETRTRHDTKEDAATSSVPPLAAEELSEEEPATNPKLPFLDSSETNSPDRQASLPPPIGSDRPKNAGPRLDTAPPQAAGDSARAPDLPEVESPAQTGDPERIELSPGERDEETADPIELDDATSQFPKPSPEPPDSSDSASAVETPAAASGEDVEDSAKPLEVLASTPLDSDVPTRPRIELSEKMAFAAGRVTSLDVPPVRDDAGPKRGSKIPPSGEPRVISSLTGRRSSIPVSSDEEDETTRPAVVVTRAKIISDRPPRPSDRPGWSSERPLRAERSDRPSRADRSEDRSDAPATAEPLDRAAKLDSADRAAKLDSADRAAKLDSADRPSDLLERAARQEAERPPTVSMRPSRRPGHSDPEEFETLDIEDGVVESPTLPLSRDSLTGLGGDVVSSKAPPPPPQQKRGVPPPAQLAPAPPPKAPPPPPRAAAAPPTAATVSGPALAAVPSPAAAPAAAAPVSAPGTSASLNTPALAGAAATKKSGQKQPRRRQWWETLFSDDYLRTVVHPTAAQIARQVDFMQASLGVAKGSSVLDVGCGLGQHALEFARRGSLVVALDLALPMITRAAEDAQQEGLRINFLHKDIRDIGFEGTFDAVVCVGTTFGFFDDEQNREVLGRLANALKPGGRLLLEVVNRDHVLLSQPNLQWFEGDGCVVMEESDFNYYSSRLTVKRTMMREDGRQTESEYSIRLYALHELGQMMQQVGFRVKEVSGQQATRGVFFGAHSNRIILLAERKTQGPARTNGNGHSDAPPAGES